MADRHDAHRQRRNFAALITIAALSCIGGPWSRAGAAQFSVGFVRTGPGALIDVDVALDDQGDDVHRAVVEVHWGAGFSAPTSRQRPDCRWHSGDPALSSASFVPDGCDPNATCEGVIVSTASAAALPSGPLVSCRIRVADSAPAGFYPLTFADGLSAFGLDDLELPATGSDGVLEVVEAAVVSPSIVTAPAGSTARVDVRLTTNVPIAGIEHHLMLPPQAQFIDDGTGGVRCAAGSAIDYTCLRLLPLPPGCTPGSDCTTMRALVDGACVGGAIFSGRILYSCEIAVDIAAPAGDFPIASIAGSASDPNGEPVELIGSDGVLRVDGVACLGDCDGGGAVEIDELILGVAIVLGYQPALACPSYACIADGSCTGIALLVASVGHALSGCPQPPTPTDTPSPTVTPSGGATATVAPSSTATLSDNATATVAPSSTATSSDSATATVGPSSTATASASATLTVVPAATPSATPTGDFDAVLAGLEAVIAAQCTWSSPGPFLKSASAIEGGYRLICDAATGHDSDATLLRYAGSQEAAVAFAEASEPGEAEEFNGLPAAYWEVPFQLGGANRYLVWQLGCWVITAHNFDDTSFMISRHPVALSQAILDTIGNVLLDRCD